MAQAHLRRLERLRARIERAQEQVEAHKEEMRRAIRDAYESGETYRDIADCCGMSHQRVWQIVNQEEKP